MIRGTAAQALSGYDRGHGVLATGGDLRAAERSLVERLSDLSGYLPLDTTFDSYWTGYPCGRYYAFAGTWPDRTAERNGTVLTHTLLVPKAQMAQVADLEALASVLRQPVSAADRDPYRAEVPWEIEERTEAQAGAEAQAIAALWFGQADRPVFWMDAGDATSVVATLWRLLWPEARTSLAFCTFALGVRRLERRPFDFLALPPEARASFLEHRASSAWYAQGKLPDVGVRHFAKEPWTKELVEQGAAFWDPVLALCREHQLPVPPAWRMRDAHRFVRLGAVAERSLNAARTRVDLLFWLWAPNAMHPLVREVLDGWLLVLPSAESGAQPFQELSDFLSREAARELAQADGAFAQRVARAIETELARRMTEKNIRSDQLTELVHAASPVATLRTAVLRAALSFAPADARLPWAVELLVDAAVGRDVSLLADALAPLAAPERSGAARDAATRIGETGTVGWLWDHIAEAAFTLRDIELLLVAKETSPWRDDEATRAIALARETSAPVSPWIRRLPADVQLAWALSERADVSLATSIGAEVARTLGLEVVADRCAEWLDVRSPELSAAAHIFARAFADASSDARRSSLQRRPWLAEQVVRLALRETWLTASRVEDALAALPEHAPWTDGILAELERSDRRGHASSIVAWLVPRLVEGLHAGSVTPSLAAPRLALAETRAYVRSASEWTLFARCTSGARGAALGALAEAAHRSLLLRSDPFEDRSSEWVKRWIFPALEAASAEQLAAASTSLGALLGAPLDTWTRFSFALAAFESVRARTARGAHTIIEKAFPIVYPGLLEDSARPPLWYLPFVYWSRDWDRAKPARRWLLDSWIDWGWPPGSFLRALGNDRALFRRMVARMARSERGRTFLQSLGDAVRAEPDLQSAWGQEVERAIADPDAAVDYD